MGGNRMVPAGTLREQDSDSPVTVFRDHDTVIVGGWRLNAAEGARLRGILFGIEPDMIAAGGQMAEEAGDCPGCAPGGSDSEHEAGCEFGPQAYLSHRPGCDCWDCKAYRADEVPAPGPVHFPSWALPDPCPGCGLQLCAECARGGRTAHHFNTAGICPDGHRLEEAPRG